MNCAKCGVEIAAASAMLGQFCARCGARHGAVPTVEMKPSIPAVVIDPAKVFETTMVDVPADDHAVSKKMSKGK